jgi:hypothetical protein
MPANTFTSHRAGRRGSLPLPENSRGPFTIVVPSLY